MMASDPPVSRAADEAAQVEVEAMSENVTEQTRIQTDAPPCQMCGGSHEFDTTVPSVVWNDVVRRQGLPEYLCAKCILAIFAKRGESFTCELWGPDFAGTFVEVRFGGKGANSYRRAHEYVAEASRQLRAAEEACMGFRKRADAAEAALAASQQARQQAEDLLTKAGTIEIAVRNPNVSSYMDHWEKRAAQAEARVRALELMFKNALTRADIAEARLIAQGTTLREALRAWRRAAADARRASGHGGGNSYAETIAVRVWTKCADDVAAALAEAEAPQEEQA